MISSASKFLETIYLFIYLAVLVLSWGTWDLSLWQAGSSLWHMGFYLVVVCGLYSSGMWAPECTGSVVTVRGLSCPVACEIFVP